MKIDFRILFLGALFLLLYSFTHAQTPTPQTQCKGITKQGNQCKIKKVDSTGYCHFHTEALTRCSATTKAGKPCRNIPQKDSKFCHIHNKG